MLFLCIFLGLGIENPAFRSCNTMRFCKENLESKSKYSVIQDKINISEKVITFPISNLDKPIKNQLLVYHINNIGFRFLIRKVDNEKFKRYHLANEADIISQEVLNDVSKLDVVERDYGCEINSGTDSVQIHFHPLRAFVYNNGILHIEINTQDNLILENSEPVKQETHNDWTDEIPNGATAVSLDFTFVGQDIRLSGFGERGGPTNLADTNPGEPLRMFNSDAYEYEGDSPTHLYGSVPFMLAHGASKSSGLFWMNPSDTFFTINTLENGRALRVISEGGFVDFVIFTQDHKGILKAYTDLTGKPMLPPLFALGYHQSRWGYKSTDEVRLVMNALDNNEIPFDSIWLDLDHLRDRTPLTFSDGFRDADKLFGELEERSRYAIRVTDPHFPQSSAEYRSLISKKLAVLESDNTTFKGDAWPGVCGFPDFLNPAAREWWAKAIRTDQMNVHIWNDMNEPSIFKGDELTFSKSLIHYGGVENREVHNVYGALNAAASFRSLKGRHLRPFVLTRSFFAGTQKHAFTWTGDNTATWEHLRASVRMMVGSGLQGLPFSGTDVGGFLQSPDPLLLARWYQVGAWGYTFFREHCHHKSARREPFLLDGEELRQVKKAIDWRYRLLPLWYTGARRASVDGAPVIRPLWWDSEGGDLHGVEDAWTIDGKVMVVPPLEEDIEEVEMHEIEGIWYSIEDGSVMPETVPINPDSVAEFPVFIRGGSIIPFYQKSAPTTYDQIRMNISLKIAMDSNGEAKGDMYLDDGDTFDYEKGNYLIINFEVKDGKLKAKAEMWSEEMPEFIENLYIEKIEIYKNGSITNIETKQKATNSWEIDV